MRKNTWRTLRLGMAAVAVGVVAAAGFALPASATEGPGNIDPKAPRSLTIHKYEQPDSGTLGPNTGQKIDPPAGSNPLEGVTFSVQRVTNIDLMTSAGWTAAQTLTPDQAIQGGALGENIGGTTNAQGELVIDDQAKLPVGLYLVQETDPGANNIVATAIPFLVGIPQPDGKGNFNYKVHVYPKNALLDKPTKAVDDSAAYELGDTVKWTVVTDVPKLSQGNSYTDFAIVDDLDERLNYTSATVTGSNGLTLAAGDYTITPAAATTGGPVVSVVLTGAGLAKLNALGGPAKITVVLSTTVASIGDGTIKNTATVFVNDPNRTKGTKTNEVETKWGALKVLKYAGTDKSKTLEGAKFDLYNVDPSGQGATPIATGLTTGTNGVFTIDGLKAGNYWLVETAAPAGFQKLTSPVAVTIVAGSTASPNLYEIANTQEPPFALPLTGGSGTMAFTLLGIGLIATAGGTLMVSRKRRANAAAKG